MICGAITAAPAESAVFKTDADEDVSVFDMTALLIEWVPWP